ncbi:hypothetical protein K474DRAFT_1710231 [Panus rudis PR-1116 ss-1]|nr:hypothetical protein K474DRAFT_1710231 [Panus rudis PR-1116 ss-1]
MFKSSWPGARQRLKKKSDVYEISERGSAYESSRRERTGFGKRVGGLFKFLKPKRRIPEQEPHAHVPVDLLPEETPETSYENFNVRDIPDAGGYTPSVHAELLDQVAPLPRAMSVAPGRAAGRKSLNTVTELDFGYPNARGKERAREANEKYERQREAERASRERERERRRYEEELQRREPRPYDDKYQAARPDKERDRPKEREREKERQRAVAMTATNVVGNPMTIHGVRPVAQGTRGAHTTTGTVDGTTMTATTDDTTTTTMMTMTTPEEGTVADALVGIATTTVTEIIIGIETNANVKGEGLPEMIPPTAQVPPRAQTIVERATPKERDKGVMFDARNLSATLAIGVAIGNTMTAITTIEKRKTGGTPTTIIDVVKKTSTTPGNIQVAIGTQMTGTEAGTETSGTEDTKMIDAGGTKKTTGIERDPQAGEEVETERQQPARARLGLHHREMPVLARDRAHLTFWCTVKMDKLSSMSNVTVRSRQMNAGEFGEEPDMAGVPGSVHHSMRHSLPPETPSMNDYHEPGPPPEHDLHHEDAFGQPGGGEFDFGGPLPPRSEHGSRKSRHSQAPFGGGWGDPAPSGGEFGNEHVEEFEVPGEFGGHGGGYGSSGAPEEILPVPAPEERQQVMGNTAKSGKSAKSKKSRR